MLLIWPSQAHTQRRESSSPVNISGWQSWNNWKWIWGVQLYPYFPLVMHAASAAKRYEEARSTLRHFDKCFGPNRKCRRIIISIALECPALPKSNYRNEWKNNFKKTGGLLFGGILIYYVCQPPPLRRLWPNSFFLFLGQWFILAS